MSEPQDAQEQRTEADGLITDEMPALWQSLQALADGSPADAFAALGPHPLADGRRQVRVLIPGAEAIGLVGAHGKLLARMQASLIDGVFEGTLAGEGPYRRRIVWPDAVQEIEDPYAFAATLDESPLLRIAVGDGQASRRALGAQHLHDSEVPGVRFAVCARHAQRVAVVGDFNGWDVRRHPMRPRIGGFWELFLPRVEAGTGYNYAITAADGRMLRRTDPVARQSQLPPGTASVVPETDTVVWTGAAWIAGRDCSAVPAPLSIYQVHAASWRGDEHNQPLEWPTLAEQLIPCVQQLSFTHIAWLPITEHPFGGSWDARSRGLSASNAQHGSPDGFAQFVDTCHRAGIGVILDWISAHFSDDAHGLAQFDGSVHDLTAAGHASICNRRNNDEPAKRSRTGVGCLACESWTGAFCALGAGCQARGCRFRRWRTQCAAAGAGRLFQRLDRLRARCALSLQRGRRRASPRPGLALAARRRARLQRSAADRWLRLAEHSMARASMG